MMKTQIVKNKTLPTFLPHGWKKEVAKVLGIHINTMTKALKQKSGITYDKIVKTAIEKYGKE